MIIVRTPYRISFFGGGTDYPSYYNQYGGVVLSTTINKYSFLVIRKLPEIFDYNYRTRYYEVQETNSIEEINNNTIREAFRFMQVNNNVDITHHGDLPNRTGIGSSSSFTVSLLHGLNSLANIPRTKRQLALDALHLEQNILQQSVGSQDQVAAAFGGFNRINFGGHQEFTVTPLMLDKTLHDDLEKHIQLFFTEDYRDSHVIAQKTIEQLKIRTIELEDLKQLTHEAETLLYQDRPYSIKEFGSLLNQEWRIKKSIQPEVSNDKIDSIHSTALRAGAYGGKLLGAGQGGFMLFVTPPEKQQSVAQALGLKQVHVNFDHLGSQVIYYDNQDRDNESRQ